MTPQNIGHLRLVSQLLVRGNARTPAQVVSWMGAMQAQDLQMSLWAVGVRMRTGRSGSVLSALNRGTILRTHVLRPTWHLVPARDLGWMLELSAPEIQRGIAARHRQLGLTRREIEKSHGIIEKTIAGKPGATRAQLVEALVLGGFSTDDNRMAHLLMLAELDQIVCSGPTVDDEPTYALMCDRVTRPNRLNRDEALKLLVTRYLQSHGPASVKDCAWWSGLSMADVRRSFEMARESFAVSRVDGTEYWHRRDLRDEARELSEALLLPAFDEFTIAYVDRSASIVGDRARAISSNGVFRPMVVVDGRVVGVWRRERSSRGVTIRVSAFGKLSRTVQTGVEMAAKRYARFAGHPTELTISEGGA